jgi:hypothetical protein
MYQRSHHRVEATGQPTVWQQLDRWVVRVDGIDTETGRTRPRQLGTYSSRRAAMTASRSLEAEEGGSVRDTVTWLVRRYVASKTDVTVKAREQYIGARVNGSESVS